MHVSKVTPRGLAGAALFMLSIVLIALWVSSLWRAVSISRRTNALEIGPDNYVLTQRNASVVSARGRICLGYEGDVFTVPARDVPVSAEEVSRNQPPPVRWRTRFGGAETMGPDGPYDAPGWLARLGIDWRWNNVPKYAPPALGRRDSVNHLMSIPYWLPALLALAIAWRVDVRHWRARWKARRRVRAGLCARCGYDVRATPTRCPECGWEPETTTG
jgi:hypothetical protein